MSTAITPELMLKPEVAEYLKRKGTEADFRTAWEIVRECFPARHNVEVELQEDPDEDGRCWVVFAITLPDSYSLDVLREQERRYHELKMERLAANPDPAFSLWFNFAQE